MGEKQLPSRIRQANSLDVCALDADQNGNQQFIIAVAGQDNSIEVYTVDYQAASDTFSSIRGFLTLRDVHKQVITKVVWAPFYSPIRAHEKPTTGSNGQPVKGAVVHLKDTRTLAQKSYITAEDGTYRFAQLSSTSDYEVWAELNGKKSSVKTISSFDTKPNFNFVLKMD